MKQTNGTADSCTHKNKLYTSKGETLFVSKLCVRQCGSGNDIHFVLKLMNGPTHHYT